MLLPGLPFVAWARLCLSGSVWSLCAWFWRFGRLDARKTHNDDEVRINDSSVPSGWRVCQVWRDRANLPLLRT